jgi:hypothetical protein
MRFARLRLTALVALLLVATSTFAAPPPAHETRFALEAPSAKSVFLAGEFNHWSKTATPMKRDADGRWTATVTLPPGKHAYKFVIDGEWKVDAANPEQTKDGFGGLNSVVTVADAGVDPVVNEKDRLRRQALELLGKSDFAQLRSRRRTAPAKVRFSDGLWKLRHSTRD